MLLEINLFSVMRPAKIPLIKLQKLVHSQSRSHYHDIIGGHIVKHKMYV